MKKKQGIEGDQHKILSQKMVCSQRPHLKEHNILSKDHIWQLASRLHIQALPIAVLEK